MGTVFHFISRLCGGSVSPAHPSPFQGCSAERYSYVQCFLSKEFSMINVCDAVMHQQMQSGCALFGGI